MSRDLLTPATFHHGPDIRATVFSPTPPYTASSSSHTPDSWTTSPTHLPSQPNPNHSYTTSVTLASPSNTARHNGLAPVPMAVGGVGTGGSGGSGDRVTFKSVRKPHDPLLSSLDEKVEAALEPVAVLHQQLTAANSALSGYLTHSTALSSALNTMSPSASLQQYVQYHHAALHALTSASSFYSIDVLYPLTDWLDDASQLSIELGHTQLTRHQLSAATDELDNLFMMKAEGAVPPSVDELITDRKDRVEKLSNVYSGQVEGVERSVRKVLEGRERMVEMVGRNWREWEWKVMRRWSRLGEVLGKAEGEAEKEDEVEEEEEDEKEEADGQHNADEADDVADDSGNNQLHSPELSAHAHSVARKGNSRDELAEEEWQTELHSNSDASDMDNDTLTDDFMSPKSYTGSTASSAFNSPPFSPTAASPMPQPPPNFPYKSPATPSVPLTPLPWRPLPPTQLTQSVWLSLLGSAYKWDEDRDELVCQYEVRAGEGKEEVEKVFRRRRRKDKKDGSGAEPVVDAGDEQQQQPAQVVRLLSESREEEVEAVMRRVGLSAQEVMAALMAVDLDKLTADKVSRLVSILPSDAELAKLLESLSSSEASSGSLLSSLSPASLLLTSLIAPMQPSLISRLQCLHYYYQLPTLSSSVLSSLLLLHQSAAQLRESTLFHHTLAAILELFNYLHPSQVAYAFDIRLLASLSNLTASPSSPSFLAFLISHLASHHPQLLSFPASLPSLHRTAQLSAASLQAQLGQLSSNVSAFRAMLDALEESADTEDAAARQRWLRLFDQLLDTQDKVEKRKAGTAAKCDELCSFLCYTQPPPSQEPPYPLPTSADALALLQLLDSFVVEFSAARQKEERRRTRRERFRVNVKEEKIKAALEAEEKRRQQQPRAGLISPRPAGLSTFSELHDRHSPPAIERMTRNPSITTAQMSAQMNMARPHQLSVDDRQSSTNSEPLPSKRADGRTPIFSIRGGASSGLTPQSGSPVQATTPHPSRLAPAAAPTGPFSARASLNARGSISEESLDPEIVVQSVVYRDVDDENGRNRSVSGVKVTRLPFQSHFTYTP